MSTPYPCHWTAEQRERFAPLSELLGVEGLFDAFPVLHVAGTNAKGSLCAYTHQVLMDCGYRVGRFISPHLYRETERIMVNDREIDQQALTNLVHQAYEKRPTVKLFEAFLYAALEHFKREQVDIAVIETGIGGSLDSTNIVHSTLCVVGTVGLDHCEILGDTLQSVARNKAGIAKAGVPLVLLPQQDEGVRAVFKDCCAQAQALLHDLSGAKLVRHLEADGSQRFDGEYRAMSLVDVSLPLLGAYQVDNAFTAAYALHLLNDRGFTVPMETIARGIEKTRWPGRLEWREGNLPLFIDGAHNPEAAATLKEAILERCGMRKKVLLIAMMADKDTKGVAEQLNGVVDEVVTTCVDEQRGLPAQTLAALFDHATAEGDAQRAFALAKQKAGQGGVVIIAGSLYLPSALSLDRSN